MFLLSLVALFANAGVQKVHGDMKFKCEMNIFKNIYGVKKDYINPYRDKLEEIKKDT